MNAPYLVTPSSILVFRHGLEDWLSQVPDLDVVAGLKVVLVTDERAVFLLEGAYSKKNHLLLINTR